MNTRNFIYISAAALLMAACTKEADDSGKTVLEGDVFIQATINQPAKVKTIMDDSDKSNPYPVYWQTGDAIAVGTTGAFNTYTLKVGEGKESATFQGDNVPVAVSGTSVYALCYPTTNATAAVNGDVIEVGNTLSRDQAYRLNTFENNTFPVAAASADPYSFSCLNLCGLIQVPVTGTGTIKQIVIMSNGDEKMSGPVSMKFNKTTGEPVSSSIETDYGYELIRPGTEDGSASVALNLGTTGVTLNGDTPTEFNFIVLPQVYTQGFTVIFIDSNGGMFQKTTYAEVVVRRSWAVRMKNTNYKTPDPLETANATIVSEAGYQLQPAFGMGNRQSTEALFGINSSGISKNGNKVSADILWTDITKDLPSLPIDRVEYIPGDAGRGNIQYRVKTDPATGDPYRGNAVIALYETDSEGNRTIIWTWHIWLTEKPKVVVTDGSCDGRLVVTGGATYKYYKSGNNELEIMDRNLGAISANPEDGWKTYGLLYQMGRKDPFPGADYVAGQHSTTTTDTDLTGYYNESTRFAESNKTNSGTMKTWVNPDFTGETWRYQDTPLNITNSIQHPLIYSSDVNKAGAVQYVWTSYSDADNQLYDEGYSAAAGSTGLKAGNGHEAYWNRTKTIFDPCPAGWTVIGDTNILNGKGSSEVVLTENVRGIKYTYQGSTSWWPLCGIRSYTGYLENVGYYAGYIDCDHITASHGWHGFYITDSTTKLTDGHSAFGNMGASVRCVRGEQTNGTEPTK